MKAVYIKRLWSFDRKQSLVRDSKGHQPDYIGNHTIRTAALPIGAVVVDGLLCDSPAAQDKNTFIPSNLGSNFWEPASVVPSDIPAAYIVWKTKGTSKEVLFVIEGDLLEIN